MFVHLIVEDKTNWYMFNPSRRMAGFNHLLVKLNHTNHSPGTWVLIYSSRQPWQVYIQLLKSILLLSASSAASPVLNCFTDETHNAVSLQINLPPWAVSAFFGWQLMLAGQVLMCFYTVTFSQKGQSPSLIPQARSMLQLSLVSADGEESCHWNFYPRGLICPKHNALTLTCNSNKNKIKLQGYAKHNLFTLYCINTHFNQTLLCKN